MRLVLVLCVLLGVALIWFSLSALYKPIGDFVKRAWHEMLHDNQNVDKSKSEDEDNE